MLSHARTCLCTEVLWSCQAEVAPGVGCAELLGWDTAVGTANPPLTTPVRASSAPAGHAVLEPGRLICCTAAWAQLARLALWYLTFEAQTLELVFICTCQISHCFRGSPPPPPPQPQPHPTSHA